MVYLYMPPRFKSPSPYIAEPRRLRFPVEVRSARNKPLTVQILNTQKPWLRGQKTNTQTMNTKCTRNIQVCKWYKRRRALKRLHQIHQIEKTIPLTPEEYLAKEKHEKKLIEKIQKETLEKLRAKAPPATAYSYNENKPKKHRKKEIALNNDKIPKSSRKKEETYNYYTYDDKQAKTHEKKERKVQKRYEKELRRIDKEYAKRLKEDRLAEERYAKKLAKAQAKQAKRLRKQAQRKVDNVIEQTTRVKKQKKYKPTKTYMEVPAKTTYTKREIVYREPLANRFTNCFYRFCCQLYCYLTFFIILGIVIVVLV